MNSLLPWEKEGPIALGDGRMRGGGSNWLESDPLTFPLLRNGPLPLPLGEEKLGEEFQSLDGVAIGTPRIASPRCERIRLVCAMLDRRSRRVKGSQRFTLSSASRNSHLPTLQLTFPSPTMARGYGTLCRGVRGELRLMTFEIPLCVPTTVSDRAMLAPWIWTGAGVQRAARRRGEQQESERQPRSN